MLRIAPLVLLCCALGAAEPIDVFLSADGSSAPHGMFAAAWGGSQVKSRKDEATGARSVAVTLREPHQLLIFNFAGHKHPTPSAFVERGPAKVAFRLRAEGNYVGELRWGWCRDHGSLMDPVPFLAKLKDGEVFEVLVDLPGTPNHPVSGFFIGAKGPVSFVLERAEIVPAPKP